MQPLATAVPTRAWIALVLVATCASPRAAALDWRVDITPAGHLFPALALSQRPQRAAAGAGNGLVRVRIEGADTPRTLRLVIDTPGLRAPAVVAVAAVPRRALILNPRLDWDLDALRGLAGVRRQILQVTLEGAGRARETRRIEVQLHPLDDALYYVREGRDGVDLGWAFAGYVDPRDPVVDDILARARRIDPDFDATAAGSGDAAARALRRVGALWAALEQRGLRYAEGDPALSRGPRLWSQRVRLPGEVWRERRANCIDASVLIAAVLERLELAPFIVLLPGHALVGFRSGTGPGEAVVIETTLLGAAHPAATNFAAARAAGHVRWRQAAAKLDGRHGPDYARIDIGTARRYGIIPFSAGERASRNPARVVAPAPAAPFQESAPP